ncbi:MAG: response regulator [Chitinispirillia bacterium]|jgi:two-component system chemotaxis response regulator CheY
MKILIAEDDMSCQLIMKKILSPYGECHIVKNGQEAVKAFIDGHNNSEPFDLICLDIMMPVMDGQEVLHEIRKWEDINEVYKKESVKIIMITALNDNVNIMKSFREQCEAYVVKPIEKEKLIAEINLLGLV